MRLTGLLEQSSELFGGDARLIQDGSESGQGKLAAMVRNGDASAGLGVFQQVVAASNTVDDETGA